MCASTASNVGPVPVPRTRLIGREVERATARSLLVDDAVPLLTLVGLGGVGKTRLALAVAADVTEHVGDGVAWVDLAPLADPFHVASTVANALGFARISDDPIEKHIAQHLRSRQTLLLLDNCEHLAAAVAALVAPLLGSCPSLQILATSRAPLRIRGEHELAIAPFPVPDAAGQATALLENNPAVQLFVERARAVDAASVAGTNNLVDVAAICRRVEGVPLAIELAAARVRALPLVALRDRLQHRLPLLEGGTRDAPARHRTVRDTIGWSYDLLPPPMQQLFRRFAVFVGGFTLEAAQAVVESVGDHHVDSVTAVSTLVESSLLRQEPSRGGDARYRMLETIREYGLEQLGASAEEQAARETHATFFLTFAEQAAPAMLGGNPAHLLHRLADDHDNLRTALEWFIAEKRAQETLRLAGACGWYWYRRGHVREGRAQLARAIANVVSQPTAALGRALYWAAELATRAGDPDAAAALAQEALAVWDSVGDSLGRARALHAVARVEQDQGRWHAATALYEEELPLWRATGDSRSIGLVLVELALVAFGQGELARAQATMLEAAAHFRRADERTWLAATELYLGLFAVAEGRHAEACRHYRACLAGYIEGGDAFLQSPLAGLALMAIKAGRPTTAAQLLGAADAELEQAGMRFDTFEQTGREQAEADARAALGDETFTSAFTSGRALGRDTWFAMADDLVAALELAESPRPDRGAPDTADLTRRERDVLTLVAEGLSDRDVAAALFVTQGTVRTHLTSIFGKLEVGSRTAAVAAARRLGML